MSKQTLKEPRVLLSFPLLPLGFLYLFSLTTFNRDSATSRTVVTEKPNEVSLDTYIRRLFSYLRQHGFNDEDRMPDVAIAPFTSLESPEKSKRIMSSDSMKMGEDCRMGVCMLH